MHNTDSLFIISAILISISIILSSISSRLGIPILVIFLAIGMLAGVDGIGKIDFNDYSIAYFISNLSLAIILLDGGMRTKKSAFSVAIKPSLSLSVLGVAITAGMTGMMASYLFSLNIIEGMLIGAIISSTDAAAVFSLIGNKGINERVSSTLELESGSNDPMAVFLTTTLISAIKNKSNFSFFFFILHFFQEFGLGILTGFLGGWLLQKAINKISLSNSLYPLLAISGGILVFSITNFFGGSGILAIYLCGFFLGNHPIKNRYGILQTFDGMAWLSQICMFLVLGLLVTPSDLIKISMPSLFLSIWLMLIARPCSIFLSLLFFKEYSLKERIFLSWVGLRGAVPIILAVFPMMAGLNNSKLYFNVAFFVVLISLLFQGTSLSFAARFAGVIIPPISLPMIRIGIDICPKNHWEQFIYRIKKRSSCIGILLKDIKIPKNSKITAIFRKNMLINLHPYIRIKKDDILCIIGKEKNLSYLSKVFSCKPKNKKFIFGIFILNARTKIYEISKIYGIQFSKKISKNISLEKFFMKLTKNITPVVGDSILFENMIWIIAEKRNYKIKKIGIKLLEKSSIFYRNT